MGEAKRRRRLVELLGETRAGGFEEFIETVASMPKDLSAQNVAMTRIFELVLVALVEGANRELAADTGKTPIIEGAAKAVGMALACLLPEAFKVEGFAGRESSVRVHMLHLMVEAFHLTADTFAKDED